MYGGAHVGLMGLLADEALAAGGEVVGVLPQNLVEREVGHRGLTRLELVTTMHERKARMAELADAFVALPGGTGTLDELIEIMTWAQLGLHAKPIALYDVDGVLGAVPRSPRPHGRQRLRTFLGPRRASGRDHTRGTARGRRLTTAARAAGPSRRWTPAALSQRYQGCRCAVAG